MVGSGLINPLVSAVSNSMHKYIVLLASLALSVLAYGEDISHNPSVTLAGETLYLANVEAGPGVVLNEYIRKGETFDNWKVLFAVRYVQTASSVDAVVQRWKAYLGQVVSPGMSYREADGSKATDRRYILSIRPPGDAYCENDVLRFIPGPGGRGVIYYQAAVRVDPKDSTDIMKGLMKETELGAALNSLTLQPVDKMPDPAQGKTSKG